MAHQNGKTGLLADLAARREKYAGDAPPIYWKSWAAITLVLIAIAMVWRDGALTIAARSEPDWLRAIAQHTTNFGKSGWILVLSGVIFIVSWLALRRSGPTGPSSRVRYYAYYATASGYMFLSVALSGIISNLVKRTIGRGRPPVFDEFGAFHFHPFAGNSLYESLLAVLCPKYRVPLLVIGFLFAMTRIMVGAHYLSDVIAGYSFGMWYAYMSAIVFARHGFFLDPRRQA
jgi:membrane-associated PAP2 superfamily phosphatase